MIFLETMIKAFLITTLIAFCALKLFGYRRSCRIQKQINELYKTQSLKHPIKKRENIIKSLKNDMFDILVVGGGCIGTGTAIDAASRGLKVALVESLDFGSETSSKSTKLLHGGVRYLQKALCYFSVPQLLLVMDALDERKTIMRMTPYLTRTVRIMVPIYSTVKILFFYLLLKLYDWLSLGKTLGRSYLMSKEHTTQYFTNLKKHSLKKAMVYYDGMMDDGRINVILAVTAAFYGATVANHVEFTEFIKDENEKIVGAKVEDKITNEIINVKAKVVISCVGAQTDKIREKNGSTSNIMIPSIGTHIVIDPEFGVDYMGILDSSRVGERVVFILPWKNYAIIGSTDDMGVLRPLTVPNEEDVEKLIHEANIYMEKEITKKDVRAAWSAPRPLIKEKCWGKTEGIVRKFKVLDEKNGLVIVAGGKWTTFRLMAEKAINLVVQKYGLQPNNECLTTQIHIVGTKRYSKDLFYEISRRLDVDTAYATHLLDMYGDKAFRLKKYITKYPDRLSEKYLFRAGEAIYCIEHELAMYSSDIVNNRFSVGYYDVIEAREMAKKIDELLVSYFKSKNIEYSPNNEYADKVFDSLGYQLVSKFASDS